MDTAINIYARRCEEQLQVDAFDPAQISRRIFTEDCVGTRGTAGGCPNGRKCRNKFRALSDVILEFRKHIFLGLTGSAESAGSRKENLTNMLLLGRRTTDSGHTIAFAIQGQSVCKGFYRECTGLRRQFFDGVFYQVLTEGAQARTKKKKQGRRNLVVSDEVLVKVLAILDTIFKRTKTLAKSDPTGKTEAMSIRSSWIDVYNIDFKRHAGGTFICTYKTFCAIRFKHRPQYTKSPRMTKGN